MQVTKPNQNEGILEISAKHGSVVLYAWKLTSLKGLKLRALLVTPKGTFAIRPFKVKKWKPLKEKKKAVKMT